MSSDGKGNGRSNGGTEERRSGYDRRVGADPAYAGPERRTRKPRRRSDRAPDKPVRG